MILKRGNRDRVMMALERDGIATKPYLPSIHLFQFYRKQFGYRRGAFPVSESVSDCALALPLYLGLKEKDIRYIVGKLIHAIQR